MTETSETAATHDGRASRRDGRLGVRRRRPRRLLRRVPGRARRQPDDRATTRSPRSSVRRAAASRTVLRCFNRMNDADRRRPRRGHGPATTASTSTAPRSSAGAGAPPDRHGVPEAQPVPEEHLRQRRLRPAARRRPQEGASSTTSSSSRCAARPCGTRCKDRLQGVGARPVRRSAAAAVHRPGDRRRARGDPDGRAVLGARPDRHARASRS